MIIKVYETDTHFALAGELKERYDALDKAASSDSRKPLSYAIWRTLGEIRNAAYQLAKSQGVNLMMAKYKGAEFEDDGSIMSLVEKAEEQLAARAAKIAGQQPPAQTFACANVQHGCPNRVTVRGEFCATCAHDEE